MKGVKANRLVLGTENGYRQKNVRIGTLFETVYFPPDWKEVPVQMARLLEESRNRGSDSVQDII